MENEEVLIHFKRYLKKRNLSGNSITAYISGVRFYFRMFDEINPENLREYRKFLISHYRPSTVNQRIYAINHFSDFSEAAETYRLSSVNIQRKRFLDAVISNEDYELLKKSLKEEENYFWYFVVRFLAATGARVSELIQIKAEHLKLGYLDLYSKGGKMRRIYLPDFLCAEALEWCEGQGVKSGFIFLNREGNLITPRGINFQLKHLAVRYGIDPDTVYPHSFRHRFAKNFLACFNDISLLADLLGHESIETTRIYLTGSSAEQRRLMDEIVTW